MTGREKLARLKSGHIPLVQALFDEAYACGHKDGRADAEEVATMLEVVPESARRWSAIRAAVATVQAATGLGGDTPLDDDAVAELLSGTLQSAARVHFAETALRVDAEANARTLEHHRRLFVGQQARAERAEAELAAAQAERDRLQAMAPRLEWQRKPIRRWTEWVLSLVVGGVATPLLTVGPYRTSSGWWLTYATDRVACVIPGTREEVAGLVKAHVESLGLPCVLPPFPGASDAS